MWGWGGDADGQRSQAEEGGGGGCNRRHVDAAARRRQTSPRKRAIKSFNSRGSGRAPTDREPTVTAHARGCSWWRSGAGFMDKMSGQGHGTAIELAAISMAAPEKRAASPSK